MNSTAMLIDLIKSWDIGLVMAGYNVHHISVINKHNLELDVIFVQDGTIECYFTAPNKDMFLSSRLYLSTPTVLQDLRKFLEMATI